MARSASLGEATFGKLMLDPRETSPQDQDVSTGDSRTPDGKRGHDLEQRRPVTSHRASGTLAPGGNTVSLGKSHEEVWPAVLHQPPSQNSARTSRVGGHSGVWKGQTQAPGAAGPRCGRHGTARALRRLGLCGAVCV